MSEDTTQCSKCGEWKALDAFGKGRKKCKVCMSEYQREYSQHSENKERRREYMREYMREYSQRSDVKDHKREYMREYHREHNHQPEGKKYKREYMREYIKRPKVKEYYRQYYQRPEVKIQNYIRMSNHRTRKYSLPNTLTPEQWQNALNYFNGCCAVCNRQLNDMFGEYYASADHWIPISYKGDDNPGTVTTNIVPLCHGVGGCNNRKSNTMPEEWLERQFGKRKAKKIAAKIQSYFDSTRNEDG